MLRWMPTLAVWAAAAAAASAAAPRAAAPPPSPLLPAFEAARAAVEAPAAAAAAAQVAVPWDIQAYFRDTVWANALLDRAPAAGGASHPILDVQFDGRLTARQAASVVDTLYEVDDMLAGGLRPPEALTVKVLERAPGASYNFGSLTLSAPYRLIRTSGQRNVYDAGRDFPRYVYDRVRGKHPVHARAVTAHEYGHALYHANIERLWPGYQAMVERTRALVRERYLAASRAANAVFEARKELKKALAQASGERRLEVERELARSYPAAAEHTKTMLSFGDPFNLPAMDAAYGELFADLIAVLHAGEARAIKKAVWFAGEGREAARRAASRDFEGRDRPVALRYDTPHSALARTRRHLWREYLSRPGVRSRAGEFAGAALRAIAAELQARDAAALYFLDAATANSRLIERLDAELSIALSPSGGMGAPKK